MRAERRQSDDTEPLVAAVRRFNRFYTQRIGVLEEGILDSPFSLAEARLLFELAQTPETTAAELCRRLGLDQGYGSRILRRFAAAGLIARRASDRDGRQSLIALTETGRATFEGLDAASDAQVAALLRRLPPGQGRDLAAAMGRIEDILAPPPSPRPYVLRPPRLGDLGWVVHRHGALYAAEYGFDQRFEGLVARIVGDFVTTFDPRREACWIAELDGRIAGSVCLVRHAETVAKLRLLYVEPEARGLGIGKRLVEECLLFARQSGYRTVTLWTYAILTAASRIYQAAGFRLAREEMDDSFGRPLLSQHWELSFDTPLRGCSG